MAEGATDKTAAKPQPDLKARLAAVRDRCAALRRRKAAAKDDPATWPRDMNEPEGHDAWGGNPAEVRDE